MCAILCLSCSVCVSCVLWRVFPLCAFVLLCVIAPCANVIALSRKYVCPQLVIHDVSADCGDVLFFVERLMCHQHDLAI